MDDSLLERFRAPGPEFGPLPIWWWSGAKITQDRLRWQMERLVEQEVRQAVVICLAPAGPLFGSFADDPPFLSPEWLELFDGACADAAELGFRLWLYDQVGFSGANFQGRLIAENPSFAGQALLRDEAGIRVVERGFDYFNPDAGAALLDRIHGTLERHVGRWFGTAIGGFFQDELPAMPAWGPDFAETFTDIYGYDLTEHLGSLWEGDDDRAAAVRRHYHEHRARLARRGFFDQHDAWYAKHGLICGFDQASPAREGDPVGGVRLYGNYLDTHSGYGAPGSDHWGDPKVHSSLAHAHGRPRTWIEAFHSSGWGGTLEETYDWLAPFLRRGATLYDPHAVYYSTEGGWWEWAPPSTCWRQPYWPSYHVFARAVARLCSVLSAGVHVCDVALMSPTATAQAYLTLDGPLPAAERAAAVFHELNGVSTWFAERRGVLERAGIDHDVLDEKTIASGAVVDGGLRVGDETYRTVIRPAPAVLHAGAERRLDELAAAGGRVITVDGVDAAADVPAQVTPGPVHVSADAPSLLRRVGDAYVLMLIAHDETSGTAAPILEMGGPTWWQDGLDWEEYWRQLAEDGYDFRPAGRRVAHVTISGLPGVRAQRWDPGTGHRTELAMTDGELDVSFEDGPIALIVLSERLPEPTREPPGPVTETVDLDGPWLVEAESTLGDRWGDPSAGIEVWRLRQEDEMGAWRPVTATFGPFAEVRGPDDDGWRPVEWSLSRGIRNDPIHVEALGPKGYVPEEFVDWRPVKAGERVALRTHLSVPAEGLRLMVGANAARAVRVDGEPVSIDGDGYQSFSPLPDGTAEVEIEFIADEDGPVRASFAVVADVEPHRRPEWLVADDSGGIGETADLCWDFDLDDVPDDLVVQVASDGPCTILINGVEVGRQGDFSPYPGFREMQVHPYDISRHVRRGKNRITLRVVNTHAEPTGAALDGAGLMSGPDWSAERGGVAVPVRLRRRLGNRDPRFFCAEARPHPLPDAAWLAPALDGVERIIPDLRPGESSRTERLRFSAPIGTTDLRIPTSLPVSVEVEGLSLEPAGGEWISLPSPLPAGTSVELRFQVADGRRGGAVLDGPIEVRVVPIPAALAAWEDLGLHNLGGLVRYRKTITAEAAATAVLDLGEVRGTADVIVNGELARRLVWGPWASEVRLEEGENEIEIVVRGTLAGYLDDASPTRAVAAGQVRAGLFGPVRLEYREVR